MEVYAAMVDRMDQGVGSIVAELKAHGLLDNTLIAYLQDNGGCAENNGRAGPAVARGRESSLPLMTPDDFQYGSTPKQTRDGFPVRQGYGVMPGPADTYVAYGRAWANVSNTPFRLYKHWQHEGGIATPLIVHWPAGLAATGQGSALRNTPQGRLCDYPGHLVDLMATAVDVAGAAYPKERSGQPVSPLEGISLVPALRGQPLRRPAPIFWEHEGNSAIRDGKWKLVSAHRNSGPGPWELYDLEADRTETDDRSATEPAVTARLAAAWEGWAKRVGVEPWPVKAATRALP
jgi:arylsulfatase